METFLNFLWKSWFLSLQSQESPLLAKDQSNLSSISPLGCLKDTRFVNSDLVPNQDLLSWALLSVEVQDDLCDQRGFLCSSETRLLFTTRGWQRLVELGKGCQHVVRNESKLPMRWQNGSAEGWEMQSNPSFPFFLPPQGTHPTYFRTAFASCCCLSFSLLMESCLWALNELSLLCPLHNYTGAAMNSRDIENLYFFLMSSKKDMKHYGSMKEGPCKEWAFQNRAGQIYMM